MLIGGISSQSTATQAFQRPAQELSPPVSDDAVINPPNFSEKQQVSVSPVNDTQKYGASGDHRNRKVSEADGKPGEEDEGSTNNKKEAPPGENAGEAKQLTDEDRKTLQQLASRDRQVRAHEQAHLSAAGGLATSGASFTYQQGPDGQRYAVGGEVSIDTSSGRDPQSTITKAAQIQRAALAPADPSSQDRLVASQAAATQADARVQLARANQEEVKAAREERSAAAAEASAETPAKTEQQADNAQVRFEKSQPKAQVVEDEAKAQKAVEDARSQRLKADQQSAPQVNSAPQASNETKVAKEEVPFEFPHILGSVPDPSVQNPKEVSFQLNKAFKNAIATAGYSTPRLGERFSAFA